MLRGSIEKIVRILDQGGQFIFLDTDRSKANHGRKIAPLAESEKAWEAIMN
jgi:hypothetical protein